MKRSKGIASEISDETSNGNITFDQKVQSRTINMDNKNFDFNTGLKPELHIDFSQVNSNLAEITGKVNEATVTYF